MALIDSRFKKILITGDAGMHGKHLVAFFANSSTVMGVSRSKTSVPTPQYQHIQLDITNTENLARVIRNYKPKLVIHTAALSNENIIKQYSSDVVEAINVTAAGELAMLCKEIDAKLIFYSTDLVYDGDCGPYRKTDSPVNPVSLYSQSKLRAEKLIQQVGGNYSILRIALSYGESGNGQKNFFEFMVESLSSGKPISVFSDQFRTPLNAHEAPKAIKHLLDNNWDEHILNLGGFERMSRFDMATIIAKVGGFDKGLIIPQLLSETSLSIARDVSMNMDYLIDSGFTFSTLEKFSSDFVLRFKRS